MKTSIHRSLLITSLLVAPFAHAQDNTGKTLIDKGYQPSEIPDLPIATEVTGSWLRKTQDARLTAVGHRVVHGGPISTVRCASIAMSSNGFRLFPRLRLCTSRTISPPSRLYSRAILRFRRLPASIPPSTGDMAPWPTTMPCRSISMTKA